jgi:hypothetical protein
MLVKVQLSLASSDGVRRVLIYNRDRSVRVEGEIGDELVAKLGGRNKVFCNASIDTHGVIDLDLSELLPEQGW